MGTVRENEIGILASSEEEEQLAIYFVEYLRAHGYEASLNEPWSGHDGFMYAPDCLKVSGPPGKRKALMIEVRNDLLTDVAWRSKFVEILSQPDPWRHILVPGKIEISLK